VCEYLDHSGRDDVLAGGVRMVPIETPIGAFRVWTKRIGNNPALSVLLLHGGPGATHEYLEACDSYLPPAGVEYYYYDQLGSAYNAYARDVLKPTMDQDALREIEALEAAGDIENPRYLELLNEHHYVHHVLRIPLEDWPNPVQRAFAAINPAVYVSMQGPSELGISQDAKLARWSRFDDLSSIEV